MKERLPYVVFRHRGFKEEITPFLADMSDKVDVPHKKRLLLGEAETEGTFDEIPIM